MKQITKEIDLVGRTIGKVLSPKEANESLWLKFKDGSFAVFDAQEESYGFTVTGYKIGLSHSECSGTEKELVVLGIVSKKEQEEAIELEREEQKQRLRERQAREREYAEAKERQLLDNLTKKYGKP